MTTIPMVLTAAQKSSQRQVFALASWDYVINTLILIGASLVAAQIRLKLPWGNQLGAEYDAQPPLLIAILLLAGVAAYGIAYITEHIPALNRLLSRDRRFRVTVVSVALAIGAIHYLTPDVSKLQVIYFGVFALVLAVLVVGWVNRMTTPQRTVSNVQRLVQNLFLFRLWLGYNIQVRYSQTFLGLLWIMLLPLATSSVLAFAFSEFLKIHYDVPFVSFLMAALVPWNLVQNGIMNSLQSVIGKVGILTQVGFPREILVLLVGGEVLVDTFFTFVALLIVNGLNGIWPNLYFLYLPYLLLIVIAFSLGLMFIASSVSVFVRDIPQLVAVALQLAFYLTPIIYPIENIPDRFKVLVLLNPMASVVQAFRDVLVYNRAPTLLTLNYPLVVGITLLYVGYTFFKSHEDRIADVL